MSAGAPRGLFADVVGQPLAVQLLEAALAQGRLAPAYLFVGPPGVGQRLVARRLLEGLCGGPDPALRRRIALENHPDLLQVEPTYSDRGRLVPASKARGEGLQPKAPPQLRLEQVRELAGFLARPPLEAPRSLVLMDGLERLAEAPANALLKTLEEPGSGLLILLARSRDQLLSTIVSRCQCIRFRPLAPAELAQVLPDPPLEGEPPALLELAGGSPGALREHRSRWAELPPGLLERFLPPPQQPLDCLALARDVTEAVETEQQLWLVELLQLMLWRQHPSAPVQRRLEQLRRQLLGHGQPRLAWEVTLLRLAGLGSG